MARSFLTPIDLNKLELQNAAIQNLATPPGTPSTGQVYYDTSTTPKQLKIYNGSSWVSVGNSQEEIEDFINGLLVAGTGISKNYDDGANSLTITNTGVTSLTGTANEVDVSASAGAVTLSLPSTINADLNGNASTASTLQTARTISLTGDASGSASFNGGSNISIPVVINSSSNVSSITGTANEIDVSASVGAVTISLPSTINADLNGTAASATYAVTAGTANSVAANSVTLGTSTTGNYVAIIGGNDGVSVTGSGSESASVTIANTDKGSSQNIFKTIIGGTGSVTAGSNSASVTFSGGTGISTAVSGSAVTITNTDTGSAQNIFKTIAVSGQNNIVADSNTDTLTFANGTGITITTNDTTDTVTVTNAGVTSLAGTTNQVNVSASVGAVTLSLPQDIHTGANPTFAGLNAGNINVGVTGDNEIDTDSGNLTIDSAGGTVTIDDNLTVTGDLTVSGSVTYLNTQTLQVSDNLVVLNYDVTGTPTENAGIEIERGTSANVSLLWNETDDRWTMTNDGTNFYVMAKKYSLTLSTSSTAYTVNHNLNDRDVVVNVYRNSAPYDTVETDVERTDANNVTLRFAVAPSANEYRVVVAG